MEEVWFFFKLTEAILGIFCMIFHIIGFLDYKEPLIHQLYACGTYFGFTLIAIFGNIGITLGSKPSVAIEALVCGVAAFFYIVSSIFSMYHAEKDFHLMYLSDYEESVHPFYAISKKQSITALFSGLFYMLHSTLALDALTITEDVPMGDRALFHVGGEADAECYQPIKLYICGKTVHEFLLEKQWYRRMVGLDWRYIENKPKEIKIFKERKFLR